MPGVLWCGFIAMRCKVGSLYPTIYTTTTARAFGRCNGYEWRCTEIRTKNHSTKCLLRYFCRIFEHLSGSISKCISFAVSAPVVWVCVVYSSRVFECALLPFKSKLKICLQGLFATLFSQPSLSFAASA